MTDAEHDAERPAEHRARRRHQALRRRRSRSTTSTSPIPHGTYCCLLGPSRLRQDHDPAHDRRPRDADRRATIRIGGDERRRPAAGAPRHRDDVPVLRAVPASHRASTTSPSTCKMRGVGQGGARAAGAGACSARVHMRRLRRPRAGAALGRPAAARRARPRADHQPARAAARRAALGARRVPAPADARRAQAPAARARHHLHPRHPHPARGDRARRPGRGHGPGP